MEAESSTSTKKRKSAETDDEQQQQQQEQQQEQQQQQQRQEVAVAAETETTATSSNTNPSGGSSSYGADVISMEDLKGWTCFRDDDVMKQHSDILAEEALKIPFVGNKEPLSALEAEFESGSLILQQKIKLIGEQYAFLRRTRGDGNCFFRSFMFSYLEHILETQDKAEVEHVIVNIDKCKKTLQNLGYAEFTYEDFFSAFLEQLESVLQGKETSISHAELLERCRDRYTSDYGVMFLRFATSAEIRRRSEFFEPFITGLTNSTVEKFIKSSVEPMNEESDHLHITALSDALGVAIRVVYLDHSSSSETSSLAVNHHDFIPSPDTSDDGASSSTETSTPKPFISLLYRPGHYDILYLK